MKKILIGFLIIGAISSMVSCDNSSDVGPTFTPNSSISLNAKATSSSIILEWDRINNEDFNAYVIVRSTNQEFSPDNCGISDTLVSISDRLSNSYEDSSPLFNDSVFYQIIVSLDTSAYASDVIGVEREDLQIFDYMPRDIVSEDWVNTVTITERFSRDSPPYEAYRYHTYFDKDLESIHHTEESTGSTGFVSYDYQFEDRILIHYPGHQFVSYRNLKNWFQDGGIINASTSPGVEPRNYVQSSIRQGCCLLIGMAELSFSFFNFNNETTEDPYIFYEVFNGRLINLGDFEFAHLVEGKIEKYGWDAGYFVNEIKTLGASGLEAGILAVDEENRVLVSGKNGVVVDFDLNQVTTLADYDKYSYFVYDATNNQFIGSLYNKRQIDLIDAETFQVTSQITTQGFPERMFLLENELVVFSKFCTTDEFDFYFEIEKAGIERFQL